MDWERTKTILIITFMFLNAVLGYQWITSKSSETQLVAFESLIIEELNKLLNEKGIQIKEEIPKDVPQLNEIIVKFNESTTSNNMKILEKTTTMTVLLSKSVRNNSEEIKQISKLSDYRYDPYAIEKEYRVFNQYYEGYPLFDVKLKLVEENGYITRFMQTYVDIEPHETEKGQKVIPAYVVIRSLAENYLEQGAVIENIQLGYHGQIYNSQTQLLVPTWRVTLGNGDVYYIHALSGSIELPVLNLE